MNTDFGSAKTRVSGFADEGADFGKSIEKH